MNIVTPGNKKAHSGNSASFLSKVYQWEFNKYIMLALRGVF
jgi:hypothetical protein